MKKMNLANSKSTQYSAHHEIVESSYAHQFRAEIKPHEKSQLYLIVSFLLAAIFSGAGAFVLFMISLIGTNFKYSGNVQNLYLAGFTGIALGTLISIVAVRLTAAQAARIGALLTLQHVRKFLLR